MSSAQDGIKDAPGMPPVRPRLHNSTGESMSLDTSVTSEVHPAGEDLLSDVPAIYYEHIRRHGHRNCGRIESELSEL